MSTTPSAPRSLPFFSFEGSEAFDTCSYRILGTWFSCYLVRKCLPSSLASRGPDLIAVCTAIRFKSVDNFLLSLAVNARAPFSQILPIA
jgi:hypothetical protein